MIRAYCSIPGYDDVRFDATPWFERATPAAIANMAAQEWTGAPARSAAKALAEIDGYDHLGHLLAYKRDHKADLRGHALELETFIDPKNAMDWLAAERPEIHRGILDAAGEDAAFGRAADSWSDPTDPEETRYLRPSAPAPSPV